MKVVKYFLLRPIKQPSDEKAGLLDDSRQYIDVNHMLFSGLLVFSGSRQLV